MHDQAYVPIDPDGPEILILGPVELVKREPRRRRVQLQVDGGDLRRLLLVTGQLCETVGKGIGDPELRGTRHTRNTFIASSPRWLMTLTAMRPVGGPGEGAGYIAVESSPGVKVDLGLQRRLERLVGIVRAEEVGVADEKALLIIVGINEPAGDAICTVASYLAGVRMEHVDAVDPYPDFIAHRPPKCRCPARRK